MKFLGAFAALSMAALVLASPEPLAYRQGEYNTEPGVHHILVLTGTTKMLRIRPVLVPLVPALVSAITRT